jgi:hypothetical protein
MQKKLHKFELASLANLCPETPEEAKALIPRYVMASIGSLGFECKCNVERNKCTMMAGVAADV